MLQDTKSELKQCQSELSQKVQKKMKKFNFTIHQYKGEDGYQKPEAIARFQMEVIGYDTAYELADAFQQLLPFDCFLLPEEVPYVLDMSDPSGTAAVQP